MNYINKESFKCLLGKQSKDVTITNNLFTWSVNKKLHFAVEGHLTNDNISFLKNYIKDSSANFHYMSEDNILILKQHFNVSKSSDSSVIIDISDLSFKGVKFSGIRHSLNSAKRHNLKIESNFRSIDDVKKLINNWSDNYAEKYFRDNSSKNYEFYKNNYHENLNNIFIYNDDELISLATASNVINNTCTYVIGKALFKKVKGLSEFTDVELYKLLKDKNATSINLGSAKGSLLSYKTKFNHSIDKTYYGKIL